MKLGAPGKVVGAQPNPAQSRGSINLGESGYPFSADYDIYSCLQRDNVFGTQTEGLLVSTGLGPPIVGRLAGSGTMLGLRDKLTTEFQTVPRGANGVQICSGSYAIWESQFNFAQKKRCLRLQPRVALVSANKYQLPTETDASGNGLVARITARYSEIDAMKILLILDKSANWHYTPFEMGVPMIFHNSPLSGVPQTDFVASEMISIHFWPEEFGPVGATPVIGGPGRTGGVVFENGAYKEVFGSYFHYQCGTGSVAPYYNEFQSPLDDGVSWTMVSKRYRNRKHVIHVPKFNGAPFKWITKILSPGVYQYGPAPHSYGDNYAKALQPAMEFGRKYTYDINHDGAALSNKDICDAMFEDLHAFFD